jgi:hypothetical protein
MPDPHARFVPEVYDHEHDEATGGARRRRPAADWGVDEELFEQMPRRRFVRAGDGRITERRTPRRGDHPDLPHGDHLDVAEGDRPELPHGDHPDLAEGDHPDLAEGDHPDLSRRDRPRPAHGERSGSPPRGAGDGRRTIVISRPEDMPSEIEAVVADRDLGDAGAEPVMEATTAPGTDRAEGLPTRRTVTISGRPGDSRAPRFHPGPQRLRAARPVRERIGARPERLAAWAFVLGLLLILIAVLSGQS